MNLGRAAEGLFWPRSVLISCDAPYWRPPSRSQYGHPTVQLEADGLHARFGTALLIRAGTTRLLRNVGQNPLRDFGLRVHISLA
jgi:hypothetical protein